MSSISETIKEFNDSINEFTYKGNTIVISLGGASIVGDGWDFSMRSDDFDKVVEEHGYDVDKIKDAMIKVYEDFSR